jgi:hypothetical protein
MTAIGPATGAQPGNTVAATMLRSSASFAQTAMAAYATEDWDVFYLHLATAVELLAKGALAHANPAFIADGRHFDSLLHLSGMGDRASSPQSVSVVRTITVTDALERVGRLFDGYQREGPYVKMLLERRNAVAHLGQGPHGDEEGIVGDVGRYVPQLFAFVGLTPDLFWGRSVELVTEHTQRLITSIEALYQRQVQACKDRYLAWLCEIDERGLGPVLAMLEPTGPSDDFTSFPVECPACGHLGTLDGDPEPAWEPDYDIADSQGYISGMYVGSINFRGHGFECRVCRLVLDEGLEYAGLDSKVFGEDDYDVSHASSYFRRLEYEDDDRDY